MVARAFNKPVLFCCESYKLSKRYSSTRSSNEQGGEGTLLNARSSGVSVLISVRRTPSELITMVVRCGNDPLQRPRRDCEQWCLYGYNE